MAKEEVFRKDFEIHSYDTDTTRQLSFMALADFLQDIASFHADELRLGYEYLLTEKKAWVLRQLKIKTYGRAWWKDAVTIETWPKAPDRLLAWRDFMVFDSAGNAIARATSAWLLIDLEQRRPVRMDPEMFEKYHFRQENVFTEKPPSMPKMETGTKLYETKVRYSRLDMNDHVNNVVFIGWVTDAYYLNHSHDIFPENFEIQYDHEVFLGDRVGIYENKMSTGEIFYPILRMEDGQRVAIAKIY